MKGKTGGCGNGCVVPSSDLSQGVDVMQTDIRTSQHSTLSKEEGSQTFIRSFSFLWSSGGSAQRCTDTFPSRLVKDGRSQLVNRQAG